MAMKHTQRFGITTIYLTKGLKDKVKAYNKDHHNNKIIMSEVARQAVEDELNKRLKEELK